MNIVIETGRTEDIDELEELYNGLNEALAAGINYPGWKKGVYPVRENAEEGIQAGCLYVTRCEGRIAGTVILNHEPEEGYHTAPWKAEAGYDKITVIHTLAVHPAFTGSGIGKALMEFSVSHSRQMGMKAIRLDVYENNAPAIRLYESCGFEYIGTVDLGYGEHGLHWFKLYEKLL
ncbi:GNAT family N-acetyltransferase [Anaerocolumna xylanovorans]|uniref:Acetyltransferase (GNAT) family protein n=1 Tax=Anaerocolumna xylanovorans DSM 12503 TaxID=1121345 RepID=A0A1M7Y4Z6_9FIRM|nr:GNAT family N-acetyltransferase [Anaerocolumna xylanovorans]SHO47462.1 Acetyltransferase (GNAT) family protein [Anaerocolumna xylanovorans DSM 12503]